MTASYTKNIKSQTRSPVALAELQTQLQDFLLDKATPTQSLTLETSRFKREDRLDIYYQAYRLRLIEALGKDFPALEKFIGAENFSELSLGYIAKYPSTHPSLRWLSQHFVQYLIEQNETQDIVELAQFEWAQVNAFDAQEIPPIDENALKKLAPEEWMYIQLAFHPSLQLLELFTPATQRWQMLEKEVPVESFDERLETPLLWAIWRKELRILFQSCDDLEATLLKNFREGNNLQKVFEALAASLPEQDLPQLPAQIASYLKRWGNNGWIHSLHLA